MKYNKDRDFFISLASHEFKTPLANIKLLGQLLSKKLKSDNHEINEILNKIDNKVDELTYMINQFLVVSKINSNSLELSFETFGFDTFIRKTVGDFQSFQSEYEINIQGKTNQSVKIDKHHFREVIINLLKNAVKYSPEEKRINVKITPGEKFITVEIRDYGIGIDKKYQKKIFKLSNFGLHISLFISSQIIKKFGGKMWIKSAPGHGSQFFFTVPYEKLS